ncbi:MAG: hypothetical protein E7K72_00460 [Roseomonas mucosa]|nr:hypothetical protein [Roseomonas mucosa]
MPSTCIVLLALPGRLVRHGGTVSSQVGLRAEGGTPVRHCAVKGLEGIAAAVAGFGRDVLAANPEASFEIAVLMDRRQPKPRGFDGAELAGRLGHQAFLRDDLDESATRRRLLSPSAVG